MIIDLHRTPLQRVQAHLFETAVAFAWTLIGVAYLWDPGVAKASPVGREVHPLDIIWSLMYLVGGPAAIYGVLRVSPRWRVAGLALLAAGLAMQGVAAITFAVSTRAFVYFIYAVAAGSRAALIGKEHR